MSLLFQVTLPIPPSVNSSTGGKNWKTGQYYSSDSLKSWKKDAAHILTGCNLRIPMCRYEYTFYPENKKFGDTENYLKATTDALVSAGVLLDDKHTILRKGEFSIGGYDNKNPRVEIRLYEVGS